MHSCRPSSGWSSQDEVVEDLRDSRFRQGAVAREFLALVETEQLYTAWGINAFVFALALDALLSPIIGMEQSSLAFARVQSC
jgi:hypothetical protein